MTAFQVAPLSTKDSKDRVVVALASLQQLHLATGDRVIVKHTDAPGDDDSNSSKRVIVGTVWPSLTLPENVIEMSAASRLAGEFQVGDIVSLEKLITSSGTLSSLPIATHITLGLYAPESGFSVESSGFRVYLKEILMDRQYVTAHDVLDVRYMGRTRRLVVEQVAVSPSTTFNNDGTVAGVAAISVVTSDTRVSVVVTSNSSRPSEPKASTEAATVSYEHIGGLKDQIKIVRELVETSLQNPELFYQYGLKPPKGVLLYGPPGTGKTLIARAVAQETGAHAIVVNGPEIISKFYGETEQKLRDLFDTAAQKAPTVIFIDEIDALCPKRDEAPSELEKRVVTTLLTLMDGATATSSKNDNAGAAAADRIVVIGATNRPNALDEALRRPGRFDREVEIGIPSSDGRHEILSTLMKRIPNTLTAAELEGISNKTHGYVGADLAAVCREAGLKCIRRCAHALSDKVDLRVNLTDMKDALSEIRPSAMREIMLEVPKVYWADIGGQATIKARLKESVEWPLQHPEAFARLGIRPPKGILLYGPPGCSKTLMAKALATEAGSNFIAVKGPELFSKWVGESEKAVREVFRKARAASPSIVFFDEIDALTVKRGGDGGSTSVADRVLSQLLNELDGIEPLVNVTVVAATNRPDIIDDALLRPGRIDRILYVGPPDLDSRRDIFRIQLSRMTCDPDVDLDELAQKSEGCSGAEVVAICQEAALFAMEEDVNIDSIKNRHFHRALSSFKRRITPEMLQFYADFQSRSGLQQV